MAGQQSIHNIFHISQGYIVGLCLKTEQDPVFLSVDTEERSESTHGTVSPQTQTSANPTARLQNDQGCLT